MNNKFLMLALFTLVFHGASFPACRIYSLQSPCSIAFSDLRKMVYANRVEIVATEDADGRVSSPFKVSGYDKEGNLTYNTVFGAHYSGTNGVPEVLFADIPGEVDVHTEAVLDSLSIGDGHFRISARKPGREFLVLVENLDALRLEAEVEAQVACLCSEGLAGDSAKWPMMDDGRRYRCSSEEVTIQREQKEGVWNVKGVLRFKGALYQKEGDFSIRFALCEEDMHGGIKTIAAGRVLGEMLEGEIRKNVVTYDTGAESVGVKLSLPKGIEPQLPHYERVAKDLEKAGIKEIPVRLEIYYGDTKKKLDLELQKEQPVRPEPR